MKKEEENNIEEEFFHFVCSHTSYSFPKILEVGCGKGRAANFMRKMADSLCLIDIDEKAVEYVKTQMENTKNVEVKCMTSKEANGTYDIIYYFLSLHHIDDTEEELKQAKRLLRNDGQLFICEYIPNSVYPMHKHDKVPWEGFSTQDLSERLGKNGFVIKHIDELHSLEYHIDKVTVSYIIYAINAIKK